MRGGLRAARRRRRAPGGAGLRRRRRPHPDAVRAVPSGAARARRPATADRPHRRTAPAGHTAAGRVRNRRPRAHMSHLDAPTVIRTKRDGGRLSAEQIDWIVDAYTGGEVADEQMSALLMAIFLRGMDRDEITR